MRDSLLSDLVAALSEKLPTDRGSFIARIKNQLGSSLQKTIDSHNTNSVIFVLGNQGQQILLKAELGENTATHKEAGWYEHLARIGLGGDRIYLGSAETGKFALVVLRYIDGAITLDEWAVENPSKGDQFRQMVLAMLRFDQSLFSETATNVAQDVVEQFLVSKYHARRKEAAATRYLDDLFAARQITINGRSYLTPDYALKKLTAPPVRRKLMPEQVGLIHGDLHTGNTLIKNDMPYYVDPNGNLQMPLEYDIAKILHSVHGQYPVIMSGAFTLVEHKGGKYEFDLERQPIYVAAHQALREELNHEQYLRSLFIEALHFATMLPHHAQNQLETTALYLRSTQLFGELSSLLDLQN